MHASAIGVLKTRLEPNSVWSRCVALNTPPFPFTCPRFSSRLQSATSSPNTTTLLSRRISSCKVWLIVSTMVRGSPEKVGSVSKSLEVGSTRSEYRYFKAEPCGGGGAFSAYSVAW